jgi:putative PIN family toxin of toxin-antitoxin system
MIKVVLDANQYASALIKPGSNSARIMELVWEGYLALIISQPILDEVRRILSYPRLKKLHGRSPEEIDRFLKRLERIAFVTPAMLSIEAVKDDPTDDKYLAASVEGEADFIISGDHHLKDLESFRGIPIVDPATFLRVIDFRK